MGTKCVSIRMLDQKLENGFPILSLCLIDVMLLAVLHSFSFLNVKLVTDVKKRKMWAERLVKRKLRKLVFHQFIHT